MIPSQPVELPTKTRLKITLNKIYVGLFVHFIKGREREREREREGERERGRERVVLQATAEWKWTQGIDDTCGICRMPFEACCVDCKAPGDDCPLVGRSLCLLLF